MLTSYDDTNATAQHTPTSNTKIVIITSRVYILYDNNLKPDRASRSIISRVMARHRDDVAQIRLPRGAEFRTVAGADEPRSPIYACCRSKKSRSDQCRPSNVTPSGPGLLVILYASNLKKKKCAAQ